VADNDFPRALYKKSEGGNSQPVWNLGTFEVKEAADQDAVDAALAEGWTLSPADEPAAPKAKRAKSADPAPTTTEPDPAPAGEAPQA
jgi:hypothetical protein